MNNPFSDLQEQTRRTAQATLERIGGVLHWVTPVIDETGKVVNAITTPILAEFRPKDVMQIVVGASVLAVPVAFTEETWVLGQSLPVENVAGLAGISILFLSAFAYFNYYRNAPPGFAWEFVKRVVSTYVISLLVVAGLMTLIQQAPWETDWVLAVKRIVIVAFPASMSATVSDAIK